MVLNVIHLILDKGFTLSLKWRLKNMKLKDFIKIEWVNHKNTFCVFVRDIDNPLAGIAECWTVTSLKIWLIRFNWWLNIWNLQK